MIVESKFWHFLHVVENMRDEDKAAINAFTSCGVGEDWAIDSWRDRLFAWTVLDDEGTPFALVSLQIVVPGVLYVWCVGSDQIAKTAKEWMPFFDQAFNNVLQYTDTHRIECYVLDGFVGAERTIKRLGFEYEGTRRSAGKNRENALLYAKVKP